MPGYIISVLGGKGGVGKTQFAANLAIAFGQESRSKTLLLDFDQRACGDLNVVMGVKGKKDVKELSEFNGSLDPKTILTFVSAPVQNTHFIGMPTDKNAADAISVDGLGKSLKAMVNIFPYTIIDVGNELTPLAMKALEFSTLIFLVVPPDILAINQSKRMYTDLMTNLFPKDMVQVIFNQYQKGHPVTPEILAKNLDKQPFAIIPRDDQSCVMALGKSQPIMVSAKAGPFGKGVTDCVLKIMQKNVLKQLEALNKPAAPAPAAAKPAATPEGGNPAEGTLMAVKKHVNQPWLDFKSRIHRGLVEEIDLSKTDNKDPKAKIIMREQTKKIVVDLINKEDSKGILNSREDTNRIVKEIIDEALGFGPLEDLLADKEVSEIMVVGPHTIYFEKKGKIKLSEVIFTNDRQVLNVIERIVAPIGRRIDEKTPYVDARLPDGSRVHAIIPPCALNGGVITIRKFPSKRIMFKDLVAFGSMTENMADFLRISVEAHRNIVVSGGTGSGKTTLINVLCSAISNSERIITCEDSAELSLPQDHVVRLETKPPSLEGDGAVDIRCLIKQCLRMRPDRIIVGECRGGETLDMLQAMNTGHDGSLTTVHSNNPRECCSRLETLVQYAGVGLPQKTIREIIASAVHLIVQQSRIDDGSRKVMYVTEIGGMQGDIITLQDIFTFKQEGINKEGKIVGKFQASGFIPKFVETLEKKGYKVPRGLFTNAP